MTATNARRRKRLLAASLLTLLAACLWAQPLSGSGFDRKPRIRAVRAKADSFVTAQRRTENFGRARRLLVGSSPTRRAFIRFDVDLKSGNVEHVILLVYSRTGSRVGYEVRLVEQYWGERRITFANAPEPSSFDFVASGPMRPRSWKAIDVSSLVDYEGETVSFALASRSAKTLELASRESGLHGPRLVVEREDNRGSVRPRPGRPEGNKARSAPARARAGCGCSTRRDPGY